MWIQPFVTMKIVVDLNTIRMLERESFSSWDWAKLLGIQRRFSIQRDIYSILLQKSAEAKSQGTNMPKIPYWILQRWTRTSCRQKRSFESSW